MVSAIKFLFFLVKVSIINKEIVLTCDSVDQNSIMYYCISFHLVSISFDNYRTIHPGIFENDTTSSEDEDLDYDDDSNEETKPSGETSRRWLP